LLATSSNASAGQGCVKKINNDEKPIAVSDELGRRKRSSWLQERSDLDVALATM